MNLTLPPIKKLAGKLKPPPDKSISHRAVIFGAINRGKTHIKNFLSAADCRSTVSAFRKLGIRIDELNKDELLISGGVLNEPEDIIDVGNSGTTIRLVAGLLSACNFYSCLSGDASIRRRPMARIIEPLTRMGASIWARCNGKYPPLSIRGTSNLQSITHKLEILSSQVKSAILLAGLFASGKTTIIEPAPTRDHTERLITLFGGKLTKSDNEIILEGPQTFANDYQITIPGDISSASYFIVAATLLKNSELIIIDVGINPTRSVIIEVLTQMGADINILNKRIISNEEVADIYVKSVDRLKKIQIGGDLIPRLIDELPLLAVCCAVADGVSIIKDAKELRYKESDRIRAIYKELSKLGAKIQELEDGWIIEGVETLGNEKEKEIIIDSYNDHRIIMSAVCAGLVSRNKITINNIDMIETSYPNFFEDLYSLSK